MQKPLIVEGIAEGAGDAGLIQKKQARCVATLRP
jgi:hypothetical protein